MMTARVMEMDGRTRRAMALACGAWLTMVAAQVAVAQQTTVRSPTVTGWARVAPADSEVSRLVKQLEENRRREAELAQQLAKLAADTASPDIAGYRAAMVRLRTASVEVLRTQQRLLALCDAGPRPDGWIGVSFQSQTIVYKKADGSTTIRFGDYPELADVADQSPAALAGLRRGDTLVMLGTTDARGTEIAFSVLLKPGSALPVKVRRDGDVKSFTLKVGRRPADYGTDCAGVDQALATAVRTPLAFTLPGERTFLRMPMPMRAPRPAAAPTAPEAPTPAEAPLPPEGGYVVTMSPRPGGPPGMNVFTMVSGDYFAGAELRRMDSDLAELTGVEDGVFVMKVAPGSPAQMGGLRGGDVIVRANDGPVVRPDQLVRAMRERDDRTLQLTVVRKGKRQQLTIKPAP